LTFDDRILYHSIQIFRAGGHFTAKSTVINRKFSRERRGIKKTIGKVAAVGGALYVGKKLAGGIEVNGEEEDDGPGFFGPRVYSQETIMDEEKLQEMEEIREEPEEEREGPFNLFGWFRG